MNFNDTLREILSERDRLRAEVENLQRVNKESIERATEVVDEITRRWLAEVESLKDDRDSWEQQASDRTDDVLRFVAERDAARAEVEALRADAERLDSGQIMIDTLDEFGKPKQVWHTGMDLRKAIDAARAAQGEKT